MSEIDEYLLPRENEHLVGHEFAEQQFIQAWSSRRLAHAWLIGGQRGIGKATLAYRMARYALSSAADNGPGLLPELEAEADSLQMSSDHRVFKRIVSQSHNDFRAVEKPWTDAKKSKRKTAITVNELREIGRFLRLTPGEGGWRVVIIDAADDMNHNAANAVLKMLEEPPRQALIILISHNPARLLPTIRSRCRRLNLSPLPTKTVEDLLLRYQPGLSPSKASSLAMLADGSIGRSLELLEAGGLDLFDQMIGVLGTLPKLDISLAHSLGDTAARGESFRTIADLLVWWLGRVISSEARKDMKNFTEVVPGEHAIAERLKDAAGLDQWVEVWEKIARLFDRATAVHLDKKRVVLNALHTIEQRTTG